MVASLDQFGHLMYRRVRVFCASLYPIAALLLSCGSVVGADSSGWVTVNVTSHPNATQNPHGQPKGNFYYNYRIYIQNWPYSDYLFASSWPTGDYPWNTYEIQSASVSRKNVDWANQTLAIKIELNSNTSTVFQTVTGTSPAGQKNVNLDIYFPPCYPVSVSASDGLYTNKNLVTWSMGLEGGVPYFDEVTGYEVWRSTNNSSATAAKVADTTVTNYSDTAVTPGKNYYYWVKAKNSIGSSLLSASDSGFLLGPPNSVSASSGTYTDKVLVTWAASSGATSYEVWRNSTNVPASATLIAGNATGTSFDDTSAYPGQTFYYWVKAKNANGASDFSVGGTGFRQLAAPSTVIASDGFDTNQIAIQWQPVFGASSYELWRSFTTNSGDAALVTNTTCCNYTDTSITPGITYCYWVKAVCALGSSAFSLLDSGFAGIYHPADTDRNWSISMREVTAYRAAWQRGQQWGSPPQTIQSNFVDRATLLWRSGEAYRDSGAAAPERWMPSE